MSARRLGREQRRGQPLGGGAKGAQALDRWWGRLAPRWRDLLIVGLFGSLTIVFFASFLFSDKMLFGTDIVPMGYAARKLYADFVRQHHALPLWNPYILGGLPFAEALHGDIFYPASLLYLFLPVHRAMGLKLVMHVFVAGVAMYVYLRGLPLRRGVAAVGGVAYMLAPYFISLIYAGHDAKMYVTALFPLLLYALERMARGGGLGSMAGGGAVVGLMLLSSHVQMAYFALWGAAIYLVALLIRGARGERAAGPAVRLAVLAAVAVLLGLAAGLVQLLPSYLYTREFSPRAGGVEYSFASSWSLHPEEVVSLALPEFGGYQDSYWGRNAFKYNTESPGTLVLFLGLAGLVGWRRWPVLPALVIGLLALTYALGAHTPIHHLFYTVVPGVKFFRAPSIIMFLGLWAAVTVASVGLELLLEAGSGTKLAKPTKPARWRSWRGPRLLLLVAGLWWVGFLLAAAERGGLFSLWTSLFYRDIAPEARQVMEGHVPGYLAGVAVAGVLLVAAALAVSRARSLGRGGVALVLVGLLFAGDLRVGRDFVKPVRLEDYIKEDQVVKALEADRDLFRVFPVTGQVQIDQNYFPIFGIQTANGFHDNRMASYDHLMQHPGGLTLRLLALLNVKYLLTSAPPADPELTPVARSGLGQLSLYDAALPRAFLVHRYRVMRPQGTGPDARGAAVEEIFQGEMPLAEEVILDEEPGISLASPPAGAPAERVEVVSYTMRGVRLRVQAAAPALLYLGDNYFPAWRVRVDGREGRILRANTCFRAVPLAAGEHQVEFTYRSPVLRACEAVSGVVGVMLLVMLAAGRALGGWTRERRGGLAAGRRIGAK